MYAIKYTYRPEYAPHHDMLTLFQGQKLDDRSAKAITCYRTLREAMHEVSQASQEAYRIHAYNVVWVLVKIEVLPVQRPEVVSPDWDKVTTPVKVR